MISRHRYLSPVLVLIGYLTLMASASAQSTPSNAPSPSVEEKIERAQRLAASGHCDSSSEIISNIVNDVLGTEGASDDDKAKVLFVAATCFLQSKDYAGASLLYSTILDLPNASREDKERAKSGQELALSLRSAKDSPAPSPTPIEEVTVSDYIDATLYPARVVAITMGIGATLDANHPLSIAGWTLSIERTLPSAAYSLSYTGKPLVWIHNISCSNGQTNEPVSCSLEISGSRTQCILFPPGDVGMEIIACPTSLRLKR